MTNGSICKQTIKRNNIEYTYYVGRFCINGKSYSVCSKTQEECRSKIEQKRKLLHSGQDVDLTLCAWLRKYQAIYKQDNDDSTKRQQSAQIAIIERFFPNVKLINFDFIQAQSFMNAYADKKNQQRKLYNLLNSALEKACLLDMINKNIMKLVELKKVVTKTKKCAFGFFEQNQMLSALVPKYASAFYFLCCTGLRVSEFLALKLNDVDMDKQRIHICKRVDIVTNEVKPGLKNGAIERYIDFVPTLLEKTKELGDGRYPFGLVTYDGIKSAFVKVFKKINLVGCSVHSTRHTFLSVGHLCKIDDLRLQIWAGHTSLSITKDIYTNLMEKGDSVILEYMRELANKYD